MRFGLIFILARFLDPSEVGTYGLFVATASFGVLLIGGDYYAYSQRELLSRDRGDYFFIVQHQVVAILVLYCVSFPVALLLLLFGFFPESLLTWLLILLLTEHIAQECNRILVALQRQILATLIFFIRSAAWALPLAPTMYLSPDLRVLEVVLLHWFIGSATAATLGAVLVLREIRPIRPRHLDYAWVRRGFRVGLTLLAGTLSIKALTTVDRYVVDTLANRETLGAYTVYLSMAMVVIRFLEPGVFSFVYPKMIKAYRAGHFVEARGYMRELLWSTLGVSATSAIAVVLLAPVVLEWIGKDVYLKDLEILWLLCVMAVLNGLSMVPHYGLYAAGADCIILITHLSALLVFSGVVWLVSGIAPAYAAPLGLIAAFGWIGAFKTWKCRQVWRLQAVTSSG